MNFFESLDHDEANLRQLLHNYSTGNVSVEEVKTQTGVYREINSRQKNKLLAVKLGADINPEIGKQAFQSQLIENQSLPLIEMDEQKIECESTIEKITRQECLDFMGCNEFEQCGGKHLSCDTGKQNQKLLLGEK